MKKLFLLTIFVFFSLLGFSSISNVDSLLIRLKIESDEFNKIDLLNTLSKQYYLLGNTNEIEKYANKALNFSKKINYQKGVCESYKNLGLANRVYGENKKALDYFQKALNISKEINDKKLEGDILGYIGLIYESEDSYEKALEKFIKSLHIRESIHDSSGIASSFNCIGIIFSNQSNFKKALEYYNKSLKIRQRLLDSYGEAEIYNNIGVVYISQKKLDLAIDIYRLALKIETKINDINGIALVYNNLGLCYQSGNQPDSALFYHYKSFQLYEKIKDNKGLALSTYNLGFDYLQLNNINKALIYAKKSLEISQEIKSLYIQSSANNLFVKIYEKNQDYKKALYYSGIVSQLNDSIYNLESQKNMAELNAKYESEKKDKELIKLEKEKQQQKFEVKNQKSQKSLLLVIMFALLIIVTVMILFTILVKKTSNKLALTNKVLTKRNIEIEQKKDEINTMAIQITKYQTQMNPHFIFNAINGFQHMILSGDKIRAINQIQSFSKLLRLTLNNSENNYLTIKDEIDYLYKYVEFELYTFSNKFDFKITANKEIDFNAQLPTMLIQPMIENAIKYADLENIENGRIYVNFNLINIDTFIFLEINVEDNGKGISNKKSLHTSKGISITKHRLALELKKNSFFIDDYFKIISPIDIDNPGTKVTMLLPYLNKNIVL